MSPLLTVVATVLFSESCSLLAFTAPGSAHLHVVFLPALSCHALTTHLGLCLPLLQIADNWIKVRHGVRAYGERFLRCCRVHVAAWRQHSRKVPDTPLEPCVPPITASFDTSPAGGRCSLPRPHASDLTRSVGRPLQHQYAGIKPDSAYATDIHKTFADVFA